MSAPEVGDEFAVFWPRANADYRFRIERLEGANVYLKDTKTNNNTILTWTGQFWIIPNGDLIPPLYVRLIKRSATFYDSSLTKHEYTDLTVLTYLDLKSFSRVSRTNRYFRDFCNGTRNNRLYKERIKIHHPNAAEVITDEIKDIRKLYFKIERWDYLAKHGGIHKSFYPENVNEAKVMKSLGELFYRPGTDAMYKFLLKERKDEIVIWAYEEGYIARGDMVEYYNESFKVGNLNLIKYMVETQPWIARLDSSDLISSGTNGHLDIFEYCLLKGVQFPVPSYHALLYCDKCLPCLKYLYSSGIRPNSTSFRQPIKYGAKAIFEWLRSLPELDLQEDLNEILDLIINAQFVNDVMIEIIKFYPDIIITNWIKNNNYTMVIGLGTHDPVLCQREEYLKYAVSLGRVTLTEYLATIMYRTDMMSLIALAQKNKELLSVPN
jgi:hypothetical protein